MSLNASVIPAAILNAEFAAEKTLLPSPNKQPNARAAAIILGLMKRVFAIDILQCERCGGPMRIVAAIHPPVTARKILDCLGLPNRAPPLPPALPETTLHLD